MTSDELFRYRDALSTWLGDYEWSHFCTLTSAFERSPRSWRRFMEQFRRDLRPQRCFWGTEANDVRPHVHCLVGSLATDPRSYFIHKGWGCSLDEPPDESQLIWQYCARRNGATFHPPGGNATFRWGRTDVQEYDPNRGAAHYVGKYVTKELNDYDLWTR